MPFFRRSIWERWRHASWVTKLVISMGLGAGTGYGGSKPPTPGPTPDTPIEHHVTYPASLEHLRRLAAQTNTIIVIPGVYRDAVR